MLEDLHIAHLTGTSKVLENNIFSDKVIKGYHRRTIGQMFFKPYESQKEFIFCARNTLQPILLVGIAVLDPMILVSMPLVFALTTTGILALGGIQRCLGEDKSAIWALNAANEVFSRLCQTIINILVLPLTALSMLTRSVSTGLKAAKIYDYDAPSADHSIKHEIDAEFADAPLDEPGPYASCNS